MRNKRKLNNNISLSNAFKFSYKLLNKREKGELKFNILLSFTAGLFEIFSLITVFPLVSILIEPELIESNKLLNYLWNLIGKPDQYEFVFILCASVSFILVTSTLINLFAQIKATRDASSAQERLSNDLFENLIYSPYKWHIVNNPNIIRNIILNNLNYWNKNVIRVIPSIAGQFAGISLAFIAILLSTPKIGLSLLIISSCLLIILLKFVRKKSTRLMIKVREKEEIINIFLTEILSGIKDIKISSNENYFIKKFSKLNHIIIKNFAAATNWNTLPTYLVILFGQLSILLTATTLFLMGIKGGELAAIMAIVVLVFSRFVPLLNKLGSSLTNIVNVNSWIDKTFTTYKEVENQKNIFLNSPTNFSPRKIKWEKVSFKKVGFRYPNSKIDVLKNLTFEIKKRNHYAFVGFSGSGKSTTIDLITGLLEPSKGSVLIDNVNLNNLGIRYWQNNINYVPQEPLISNLSLRENIAFGIPEENINNEKIYDCLKQTNLIEVANSLNEGIYTNLGNQGISLSGGQKQRVAISRALYHDNDILILDEATSSLDTETELIIQKTIKNLKNKITIISIAHRLSTIKNCDCIFLIQDGEIIFSGDYDSLNEKSPEFRKLSSSQIVN